MSADSIIMCLDDWTFGAPLHVVGPKLIAAHIKVMLIVLSQLGKTEGTIMGFRSSYHNGTSRSSLEKLTSTSIL
jgi:hypothetical protein